MANRNDDIALIAHLVRRAGFGAPRGELETLAAQGYDATLEQLLGPQEEPGIDELALYRYLPAAESPGQLPQAQLWWLYNMVNTKRPLQEKTALFWHQVFATGNAKVESALDMHGQIEIFREHGLGNLKDLFLRMAKNPAMIYWLDNNENHKRAPNENWGRELLELFSLGVGSYTEKDVYEASRAFTGWTMAPKIPGVPWGPHTWDFKFVPEDHDFSDKEFLGHSGALNGDDIIDIIVQQPACTRFIARHLYNFFVADEPPVPTWPTQPPRDPKAIELISETLLQSGLEIAPVLRAIFSSDFFKGAMYEKVRNPVEMFVSTMRITGDLVGPDPRWTELFEEPAFMGQEVFEPPTVEGWHTGREWINSGALINRVNFVADRVSDTSLPGVRDIVERIASANGGGVTPQDLVDRCLDLIGPMEVHEETRKALVEQAADGGPIDSSVGPEGLSRRVGDVLALIAGTREYQFG